MCQYGDEHTSNVLVSFKFDNFSSRAPESTVHGRILAALPFLQILLQFVLSCCVQIAPKKEKNLSEFASRPRDIEKSLSSPDSPQIFIHKVHFQSHAGGDRPGGVCCIFLEGGRPNAAVKPRYFLPYPSYVCRQETKPPNVFSKKTKTLFIFKLDRKRTQHVAKYLLALQGALHTCIQDLYSCIFVNSFKLLICVLYCSKYLGTFQLHVDESGDAIANNDAAIFVSTKPKLYVYRSTQHKLGGVQRAAGMLTQHCVVECGSASPSLQGVFKTEREKTQGVIE